jgi:hypothetical protein
MRRNFLTSHKKISVEENFLRASGEEKSVGVDKIFLIKKFQL